MTVIKSIITIRNHVVVELLPHHCLQSVKMISTLFRNTNTSEINFDFNILLSPSGLLRERNGDEGLSPDIPKI